MEETSLLPWQAKVRKAVADGASVVLVMAGRKSGKTELILRSMKEEGEVEPLKSDQINPYIAPYRTQAKNIYWRRLKNSFDHSLLEKSPKETELAMDLKSGLRIQLLGADKEDNLRGLTFGPTKLDEADDMRPGFFGEVCEPNLAPTQAPVMIFGTPKGGWFTKLWKSTRDGMMPRSHAAFHFTIYDNPTISRSWIEKKRISVSREVWEQEYLAKEGAYAGLQYAEFGNENITPHREPKNQGKFGRSIDWGYDHPTGCLWAEIFLNPKTGRWGLYFYREMLMRGKSVAELARPILAADARPLVLSVLDSSAKRTEMGTGRSIANEFRSCGVSFRLSMRNDAYNVNATKQMLRSGDILVSLDCPQLISQLRSVEWGQAKDDELTDCVKYIAGYVYGRDFANIETVVQDVPIILPGDPSAKWPDGIDPTGILAAPGREDAMEWAPY